MKTLLLITGFISLSLGSVGIIVPFLPTTPFFLITTFCFAKSSTRLNNWFKSTNIYKNNLQSLAEKQGLTRLSKLKILGSVSLLLGIGAYFMRDNNGGLIILAMVWLAHVIVFGLIIKTKQTTTTL